MSHGRRSGRLARRATSAREADEAVMYGGARTGRHTPVLFLAVLEHAISARPTARPEPLRVWQ